MLPVNMFVELWRGRRVFFDVALIPMLALAVWELFDLAPQLAALVDAPLLNPVLDAVRPLLYIWIGGVWLARIFLNKPPTLPRMALFMAVSFPLLTYGMVLFAPLANALLEAIKTEFGHAWLRGGSARADNFVLAMWWLRTGLFVAFHALIDIVMLLPIAWLFGVPRPSGRAITLLGGVFLAQVVIEALDIGAHAVLSVLIDWYVQTGYTYPDRFTPLFILLYLLREAAVVFLGYGLLAALWRRASALR